MAELSGSAFMSHTLSTLYVAVTLKEGGRGDAQRLMTPPCPSPLGNLFGYPREIFSTSLRRKLPPLDVPETISSISALPDVLPLHTFCSLEREGTTFWLASLAK